MTGNLTAPAVRTPSRIGLFVAAQLVLVTAAVAGVAYRTLEIDRRLELPPLRETPLDVPPQFNEPLMIGDDELAATLRKLRPRLEGPATKVGNLDHNLRFWGPTAQFDDPFIAGEDLRQILTDHRRFQQVYGDAAKNKPLLLAVPESGGVRYRDLEGPLSSPHNDHTMASLAEVGTPLSFPIVTEKGNSSFRAVVEQSLRDFSLNQPEYEWSALTFALLLRTNRWVTAEGQEVSFDLLADRIMRQELPQGVCMGNHRLHALVMLLRVDETWDGPEPMLSGSTREKIVSFLEGVTAKLVAHQHADGFWNGDWPTATPTDKRPTDREGDGLGDRIIATGHALEWWALVPQQYAERILPPRNVRIDAARWLVRTIDDMSDDEILANSSFLSHAGRALALWRGRYPHHINLAARADGANNSLPGGD